MEKEKIIDWVIKQVIKDVCVAPDKCITRSEVALIELGEKLKRDFKYLSSLPEAEKQLTEQELIEQYDNDYEKYPLPICFDHRDEQRELYGRTLKIQRDVKALLESKVAPLTQEDHDLSVQYELEKFDTRIRVNCPDEDNEITIRVKSLKQYTLITLDLDEAEAVARYILGPVKVAREANP